MKKTVNHIALSVIGAMLLASCTKTNTVVKPKISDTTKTQPSTPVPQDVVINMTGVSTTTLATGFNYPTGMAVDKDGNVFVADALNNCIKKIAMDGTVTVVAGLPGVQGYVDGNASDARFYRPSGVVIDDNNNLYVADTNNQCIRKITPAGVVSTFVDIETPIAIARDATTGNLYTSHFGYDQVDKITPDGTSTGMLNNVRGDGMVGVGINFAPAAVAVDAAGNVYASDYPMNSLRKIAPDGTVTNITVNGPVSGPDGNYVDGALADAHFHGITGLTIDATGKIYVADWGNSAIRVIDLQANTVKTLAGNGSGGSFGWPEALAIDGAGNIYVAEPNDIKVIHH